MVLDLALVIKLIHCDLCTSYIYLLIIYYLYHLFSNTTFSSQHLNENYIKCWKFETMHQCETVQLFSMNFSLISKSVEQTSITTSTVIKQPGHLSPLLLFPKNSLFKSDSDLI